MKQLVLISVVLSCTTFAQINITSSDFANQFSVGNSVTIHESESPTTIDIGSQGGGNNWDFSMLQGNLSYDLTSVDPATTPHSGEFSGANIATYSMGIYNGEQAEIWQYLTLNGSFDNMGSAVTLNSQPGDLFTIKNNPPSHEAVFPLTYNSSWMQTYTQTLEYNGTPLFQSTYSIDVSVDAYGTMTMPGGASFEALRSRYSQTEGGNTYVDYIFYSKSGAQVSLYASDINPPTSGVINIEGYTWNLQITSSVEQLSGSPNDYSLSQNYPNPFNPSTSIEYSIPEASFVQLKVYDVLGNEVATLVDEEHSAGTYRADFNGEGFSSGLYIAKLQAGNYTKSIKMTLMK